MGSTLSKLVAVARKASHCEDQSELLIDRLPQSVTSNHTAKGASQLNATDTDSKGRRFDHDFSGNDRGDYDELASHLGSTAPPQSSVSLKRRLDEDSTSSSKNSNPAKRSKAAPATQIKHINPTPTATPGMKITNQDKESLNKRYGRLTGQGKIPYKCFWHKSYGEGPKQEWVASVTFGTKYFSTAGMTIQYRTSRAAIEALGPAISSYFDEWERDFNSQKEIVDKPREPRTPQPLDGSHAPWRTNLERITNRGFKLQMTTAPVASACAEYLSKVIAQNLQGASAEEASMFVLRLIGWARKSVQENGLEQSEFPLWGVESRFRGLSSSEQENLREFGEKAVEWGLSSGPKYKEIESQKSAGKQLGVSFGEAFVYQWDHLHHNKQAALFFLDKLESKITQCLGDRVATRCWEQTRKFIEEEITGSSAQMMESLQAPEPVEKSLKGPKKSHKTNKSVYWPWNVGQHSGLPVGGLGKSQAYSTSGYGKPIAGRELFTRLPTVQRASAAYGTPNLESTHMPTVKPEGISLPNPFSADGQKKWEIEKQTKTILEDVTVQFEPAFVDTFNAWASSCLKPVTPLDYFLEHPAIGAPYLTSGIDGSWNVWASGVLIGRIPSNLHGANSSAPQADITEAVNFLIRETAKLNMGMRLNAEVRGNSDSSTTFFIEPHVMQTVFTNPLLENASTGKVYADNKSVKPGLAANIVPAHSYTTSHFAATGHNLNINNTSAHSQAVAIGGPVASYRPVVAGSSDWKIASSKSASLAQDQPAATTNNSSRASQSSLSQSTNTKNFSTVYSHAPRKEFPQSSSSQGRHSNAHHATLSPSLDVNVAQRDKTDFAGGSKSTLKGKQSSLASAGKLPLPSFMDLISASSSSSPRNTDKKGKEPERAADVGNRRILPKKGSKNRNVLNTSGVGEGASKVGSSNTEQAAPSPDFASLFQTPTPLSKKPAPRMSSRKSILTSNSTQSGISFRGAPVASMVTPPPTTGVPSTAHALVTPYATKPKPRKTQPLQMAEFAIGSNTPVDQSKQNLKKPAS